MSKQTANTEIKAAVFHRLLKRQCRKAGLDLDDPRMQGFYASIAQAYSDYDADMGQLENTLEISSQELYRANMALKEALADQTAEMEDVNRRLNIIVDNIREVIFQLDLDLRWTYLNPAWTTVTGIPVLSAIGKPITDFMPKKHSGRIEAAFNRIISGEEEVRTTVIGYRRRDGHVRFLEVFIRAQRDSDGQIIGTFGTLRDVTAAKNFEQQLIEAKNEAEAATKAKAEFLSTMSHEIRTPMNAVIGVTHLLLQDNPREDQLENLNTLKFSAENLLVIINDILDYNKIESGKVGFESNDIHIENLARSIKNSFAFKAEEKGIRLKVKIDEDLPEFVRGDSTRLAQVLTNLVGNAIKFTEQGSVVLDIEVQEESDERVGLRFMIKDSGIGIPSNKLDVIFDRFSQASASTTRRHVGTGLGLAICQGLLELQDSRLHVESEEGKGSTFWFDLSFLRSERVMTSTNNSGPTFINSMPSFAGLQGTRVLLVEDNMLNVAVTRQFLRKWQVEMVHAENGVEALKVLENDLNFHVVLMDLQMPEMDGYECSRRIRENDETSHLPIIALTASAMPEVVMEVKQKGMNDFVTKPFHPADLYMKIRNCSLRQAS